ncbi:unnamed protein product [Strongylus vulgaris]|uniref:Importin N-terminal domain-containing protein n=1 Tax=Strongylus vulgaris TaxID=40348 RepID=A0A3P7J9C1_STRVU|nr:unnamed protein product [Strongylus vulgaris]
MDVYFSILLHDITFYDIIYSAASVEICFHSFKAHIQSRMFGNCSKQRGFTPELLSIACDASVAEPVRQAAVIYFKNTIVRLWESNDDSVDKSETVDFCLSDEDKALVRDRIVNAVCAAGESLRYFCFVFILALDYCRTQLCIAIQQIIRMDFPDKWPQFVTQLTTKLASPPDASVLSAGLLILYRLAKVYEYIMFKRNKDRDDIAEPVSKLEPFVYYHCHQLLNNQSAGSLDSIEDRDERAHTVWWKCKKWAAKILERIFDRYGSPNQVEKQYAAFANHFLSHWARPALETMLMSTVPLFSIGFLYLNVIFIKVLYLALSFTNTAVAHSHCWKTMKPHALDLIKTVLFRLMSYTKADEEMWDDNAEEYVRFKFVSDIFEDLHNPASGAGALLRGLAKRKDIVQPVLAFAIQV